MGKGSRICTLFLITDTTDLMNNIPNSAVVRYNTPFAEFLGNSFGILD